MKRLLILAAMWSSVSLSPAQAQGYSGDPVRSEGRTFRRLCKVPLRPLATALSVRRCYPINYFSSTSRFLMNRGEINALPNTSIFDAVALAPRTYQRQRGAEPLMGGSDNYGTLYVIDGIRVARN